MKVCRILIILLFITLPLLLTCSEENTFSLNDDNNNNNGNEENVCPDSDSDSPPTIEAIPDTSISLMDFLRIQAVGNDPDGDTLQYGAVALYMTASEILKGLIPNISIDSETGELIFIPQWFDAPRREIRVLVYDPCNKKDYTDFMVEITE